MSASRFEDDNISFCSMISGETCPSARKRKPWSTLRQQSVENRAIAFNTRSLSLTESYKPEKSRFNKSFHSYRYLVAMMAGFALGSMMYLRYIIAVAILKMLDQSKLYLRENVNKTIDDFLDEGYTLGGEFDWDNEIQQMIMSWYMFAYTIPQVPLTKLGTMIGARLAMPIFLAICVISTLLTPIVAYYGWQWVIVLRMVNGAGASAVLPMMLTIIENWMPYEEVTLGLTFAQLMQAVLLCLNPMISGYLSSIHWSLAFYVPGTIVAIFCVIWLVLVTDRPEESWLLSEKELNHICNYNSTPTNNKKSTNESKTHHPTEKTTTTTTNQTETKIENLDDNNIHKTKTEANEQTQHFRAGWLDILKVPSFYAYLVIWIQYCSSYSGFNFVLPNYLRQFLKISIFQNGFYCTLIQTGCILAVIWPHPCLRILQEKFKLSLTAARRITHIILCCSVAASWSYVALFHDSQLILFFMSRCFHGSNDIVLTGTVMTNFAKAGVTGLAFSMINTVGNLSVVFISTLVGWLLDYTNQSVEGWSIIFLVGSFFQINMMLLYFTIRSDPIEFVKKVPKHKLNHIDCDNNPVVAVQNLEKPKVLEPVAVVTITETSPSDKSTNAMSSE